MARVTISGDYYGEGAGVDNYGSATNPKYIPSLWAKKALRNFYASTFYTDICNTDYSGELKNQGDIVYIRKTPEITVNNYSIGGTVSYEVPAKDSTQLVVDKALYAAFRVDDVDKAQSDMELINMFAEDTGYRMKIKVDQEVLAYMGTGAAATNKGNTAGAISDDILLGETVDAVSDNSISIDATNAITKIVEINQVLDEANQPSENRWIVLPAWYCALLKQGDLKRADITGDGKGGIRSGLIGQIDRTMIYQSNNLSVYNTNIGGVGAGDNITRIIAGTKEATSFAAQISKTDTLPIPDSFGTYWRTLMVYGRAVVQDAALVNMLAKRA
jgi:hypothetical protein